MIKRDARRCSAAVVAGALTVATAVATARQSPLTEPRGDVFVIGTMHAPVGLLLDSSYSAAHLRATLDRFGPDAIGVETPPLWNAWGVSLDATWEIEHVVVPWAAARDVGVYGVAWVDVEDLASRARRRLASSVQTLEREPRTLAERRARAVNLAAGLTSGRFDDFADPDRAHAHEWFWWINSGARSDAPALREWWESAGSNDPAGAEMGARVVPMVRAQDDRIVEQVLTLLRRHPDGRVAVLFGYSHKYDLDRKLARHPGVRVLQLGDVALSRADIANAWRPEDALATLHAALDGEAYSFNPGAVDQGLVARALEMLRGRGAGSAALRYYEGRLLAVQGRTRDAMGLLRSVLESSESTGVSRPPVSRGELTLRQRARVELGKLLDLLGDRPAALEQYRQVFQELERARPTVPSNDAFPTASDWATAGFRVAQQFQEYAAAHELLRMFLREPWVDPAQPESGRDSRLEGAVR